MSEVEKQAGWLAIISDIHGNLPALLVVLEELDRRGIKRVACLGDIVGYGPYPTECLDLVRARAEIVVRGNHDEAASQHAFMPYFNKMAQAAMSWTRGLLSAQEREYLSCLPLRAEWEAMSLVHANFLRPGAWEYIRDPTMAGPNLDCLSGKIGIFGHTHRPIIYRRPEGAEIFSEVLPDRLSLGPGRCLINPGSVGQPRDQDPRAAFLLISPGRESIELLRLPYEIKETQQALKKAGLPDILGERLVSGT